jgi:hypothetical protein
MKTWFSPFLLCYRSWGWFSVLWEAKVVGSEHNEGPERG